MSKLVLIDLDGTLTDTTDEKYRDYRDGRKIIDVSAIPLINGALGFVQEIKRLGHTPVIVSDSHPDFVNLVAKKIFNLPALCLAEKPNKQKTVEFIRQIWGNSNHIGNTAIVIGDTWLDIELGRALNCPTILMSSNSTGQKVDTFGMRYDGVGQIRKSIKSGPTFCARTYKEALAILQDSLKFLLAAEGVFKGVGTSQCVKFDTQFDKNGFLAIRALGRQEIGEIDCYGIATKYFEFQRADRSVTTISLLAKAVENYLKQVLNSSSAHKWDYFTYVTDKATTNPPNKMKELFDLVECDIPKVSLLKWGDQVTGSIRNQENYKARVRFVDENLFVDSSNIDLEAKNIVVIDDQITTGGTANSIYKSLVRKGVKNVLFISLFYLIDQVYSDKLCPKCGKKMVTKINRTKGNKFYSCTPPKYKGDGCGYAENILVIQHA